MSRQLPTLTIAGTEFEVDLRKLEFREVAHPKNRISLFDMADEGDYLLIHYDTRIRNAYRGTTGKRKLQLFVQTIRLPGLRELDPFNYTLLLSREPNHFELLKRAEEVFKGLPPCPPKQQTMK